MGSIFKKTLALSIALFLLGGCAGAEEKVRETTRPVGSGLGVVQAVPEGVAQGYASDNQSNPYNR